MEATVLSMIGASVVLLLLLAKTGGMSAARATITRFLQSNLGLTTLASSSVASTILCNAFDTDVRVSSINATWNRRGGTAGEGPIYFGVAHSDYTDAEIEEYLELASDVGILDPVDNEKANRMIRFIGSFSGAGTDESLNDGNPVKTKLNWPVGDAKQLNMWAYNRSGGALTTGCVVEVGGQINFRPQALTQ